MEAIKNILVSVFSIVLAVLNKLVFDPVISLAMTKYRWVLVIPFVLPMSLVYNFVMDLRNRYVQWTSLGPKLHDSRVQRVVKSMKEHLKKNPGAGMCTARPGWQTMSIFRGQYKNSMFKVDLSDFVDILSVDEKKRTVKVEPLVTCGQLTSTLIPRGWTLDVMPELDDLTVGGLISGFGVETSSHKYGLFQYICESFEIILADGTLCTCSKTENPDLYYAIPWSHGTIGFLVAAEIRIQPVKQYVKVNYEPFSTQASFLKAFDAASRDESNDFVEALAYTKDQYVLMRANMTNAPESSKIFRLGAWYGPWFYKHVEQYLTPRKEVAYDYIPIRDYYHRHTRSLFWEMHDILPFGDHPLFRYTLGWLVTPKPAFLKLTTNKKLHEVYKKKHVDQDFLVPMAALGKFIDKSDQLFKLYPLWLCPCKILKTPVRGLINPDCEGKDEMYVDVGIYGVPYPARPEGGDNFNPRKSLRDIEAFTRDIKGYQALYAITYMNREEFYQMFDHSNYNKIREKYKCDGKLPVIFDKVSLAARGEDKD
eukprot:TRINITY_DN8190_c0_g1_i1.p1 TRINITY_DN8190_c0_g1~~TRINITY_DN8190_c0_g1_i1.p1  ORF type:complete len:537 (-),score=125.77 TRINITY_DN8190_c0_g1_i1:354-1964(-)